MLPLLYPPLVLFLPSPYYTCAGGEHQATAVNTEPRSPGDEIDKAGSRWRRPYLGVGSQDLDDGRTDCARPKAPNPELPFRAPWRTSRVSDPHEVPNQGAGTHAWRWRRGPCRPRRLSRATTEYRGSHPPVWLPYLCTR
ncbi:hypothetical protein E2562_008668 [Oryza meyeriana var. granulata]|uniref:Uncharacterized protein n=1 Tax=Oryza meyeriana var. granulata TaxID=110450 RepID=A0A6G1F5M4_9ORYZ|nr:hypothetical protein E2562_008668 [Oryza meyeriana var. granulata]